MITVSRPRIINSTVHIAGCLALRKTGKTQEKRSLREKGSSNHKTQGISAGQWMVFHVGPYVAFPQSPSHIRVVTD